MEEERRLAYVAITRAKQKLYISMAHNRRVYGQWQNNIPSRFINELPSSNLDICNKCSNFYTSTIYSNQPNKDQNHGRSFCGNSYRSGSYRTNNANVIGTKVYHETFGYGKIVAADNNVFHVCFENGQIKKLMGSYLTKV